MSQRDEKKGLIELGWFGEMPDPEGSPMTDASSPRIAQLRDEVEKIIRFVPDKEHPKACAALHAFIDGEWHIVTDGERACVDEMHADLAWAIEDGLYVVHAELLARCAALAAEREQWQRAMKLAVDWYMANGRPMRRNEDMAEVKALAAVLAIPAEER